jgi:type IV pilus assembly protein PilX
MTDRPGRRQRGVVLPVALILLVIVSFAGLFAARNSANHEQFSNNLRTTNVARQAAEIGLRFCESVVIDIRDNDGLTHGALAGNIASTEITDGQITDSNVAVWASLANWSGGSANLITAPLTYDTEVKTEAQLVNAPTCIAQLMTEDRVLVTARGLSNDAQIDGGSGRLVQGSEIWLQSILTPGAPLASAQGGRQ